MKVLIILLLLLAVGVFYRDLLFDMRDSDFLSSSSNAGSSSGSYTYPKEIRIRNSDGQELWVNLTGRSDELIQFNKVGERTQHTYLIGNLERASQKEVMKFPWHITLDLETPDSAFSTMYASMAEDELRVEADDLRQRIHEAEDMRRRINDRASRANIQYRIDMNKKVLSGIEQRLSKY